jgi:hypothetical protein
MLMEYEKVTHNIFTTYRINFMSYFFIFRKQFHNIIYDFKIIGHENPDNNLESLCIIRV